VVNSSPTVEDLNIEDTSVYNIYMDSSSTDVDGCTIDGGTDGIRIIGGTPKVTDCTITDTTT
ncbi:MAG: hypothetical protein GWN18_04275, partial [Thermoplasmata archaeon]|nr:hypothetical protein [Thermoplasmata archaeon]NIS11252.1 hypothetical protein [Thermoplasmata archaeon]NIS19186.1 hypothetical protein [Thermoplasmata archaeon]NIT78081.1 hypothetical protein [Thermoplasmata archaeon]NIU48320.1 hypothetical protein [Thermoplasmata archaeon]